MKKWVMTLLVFGLCVAAVVRGAIWYIKPAEELDLNYSEVPISSLITDMIKNRRFEVTLSEQDVNNLAKKQLAQQHILPHHLRLTGARFDLQGSSLTADVNLKWRDQVPIGARLYFELAWNSPNLLITHTRTQIRNSDVPLDRFHLDPITLPIETYLPQHISIKSVNFDETVIRIGLRLKSFLY